MAICILDYTPFYNIVLLIRVDRGQALIIFLSSFHRDYSFTVSIHLCIVKLASLASKRVEKKNVLLAKLLELLLAAQSSHFS